MAEARGVTQKIGLEGLVRLKTTLEKESRIPRTSERDTECVNTDECFYKNIIYCQIVNTFECILWL